MKELIQFAKENLDESVFDGSWWRNRGTPESANALTEKLYSEWQQLEEVQEWYFEQYDFDDADEVEKLYADLAKKKAALVSWFSEVSGMVSQHRGK